MYYLSWLKSKKYQIIAAVLSGCAVALSFPTQTLDGLVFVALIPLLWSIQHENRKTAFVLGWLQGISFYLLAFSWVPSTITVYGGFWPILSVAMFLALAMYSGLMSAVFTLSWKLLLDILPAGSFKQCVQDNHLSFRRPEQLLLACMASALLYIAPEWWFPQLFPWHIGNALYRSLYLIQITDLFGVYGVSALIVIVNYCLYRMLISLKYSRVTFMLPLFTLLFCCFGVILYGVFRIETINTAEREADTLGIGVIQANIPIFAKEDPHRFGKNQEIHQDLSRRIIEEHPSVDLIVWPETAMQSIVDITQPDELHFYRDIQTEKNLREEMSGVDLIFGGIGYEKLPEREAQSYFRPYRLYNTAFMQRKNSGLSGFVNKNKLLLFGEYLPFSETFPRIQSLSPNSGNFNKGKVFNPLVTSDGSRMGMLICYEDLIPSFARRYHADKSDILINLTNDAWFGKSKEPFQHLALAVFRTLETRKWLIRSVNTGVSAIIDAKGKIVQQTDIYKEATLFQKIPKLTIPTVYSRVEDVLPIVGTLFSLLLVFLAMIRRKKNNRHDLVKIAKTGLLVSLLACSADPPLLRIELQAETPAALAAYQTGKTIELTICNLSCKTGSIVYQSQQEISADLFLSVSQTLPVTPSIRVIVFDSNQQKLLCGLHQFDANQGLNSAYLIAKVSMLPVTTGTLCE